MEKVYTVIEVSKMLNVTRQCIYSKLNTLREELKENITIKDNTKYLNENAIEIIKKTLKNPTDKTNNKSKKQSNDLDINLTIQMLKEQLKIKDEQLKSKDKLIENMQILLKKEQENSLMLSENLNKNMLLLEDDRNKIKKSIWQFWRKS